MGSNPVGATKFSWLMFDDAVFEDGRSQGSNTGAIVLGRLRQGDSHPPFLRKPEGVLVV